MSEEKGTKYDDEKVRLDLLSSSWIDGVGKVLTFGARKYSAHNWRLGINRSRLLGACLRHIFSYLGGEDADPETGLSHLYHASCCLMFASELHITSPETDDRWKSKMKESISATVVSTSGRKEEKTDTVKDAPKCKWCKRIEAEHFGGDRICFNLKGLLTFWEAL